MNFEGAPRAVVKAYQRQLAEANRRYSSRLELVPELEWPAGQPPRVIQVWRSNRYLVQVYAEPNGVRRLSVIRTLLGDNGRFVDGITWDELQAVKAQAGFGDRDAIEIYPADADVVDVANMRHLWVLPEPFSLTWRTESRR